MSTREIEEFAQRLVGMVRDRAIQSCDANWRGVSHNAVASRWRQTNGESAAAVVIPDAIDEAMFYLLTAIDQGLIRLIYVSDGGEHVDLSEAGLGELGGWYVGPDGWREKYSSERQHPFLLPEDDE
jgi:hypothetical protein